MSALLHVILVWIVISIVFSLLLGRAIAVGKGKPLQRDDEQLRAPVNAHRRSNQVSQPKSPSKRHVA